MRDEYEHDIFNEDADDTKGLYAQFYMEAVQDQAASLEAGRPIFKEVEMILVGIIGDRTTTDVMESNDYQRQRFGKQYHAFRRGMSTDETTGTPLSEVPWMSKSQIEEFKFLKIRSLEDLANVSDSVCTKVSGLFALKARATAWIEEAKGGAGNAVLAKQIEELQRQMAGMIAAQTSLENTKEASKQAKG